ncbi:LysR family transcriptional regulator [Verminephrobacter aporrectodeae]|uniref:LysR family transcriptional regulator n=1 Tax=Verminephrobacter aporrectodeae TaxID=1110389 RepID=UPI0002375A9D|nr:LysR family transcriptional regulator [Verminephrobacter aporrectodeae]
METAFLQTFALVAQTGSMAEAARRQDLSATAVALQLRALERELGATLVARSGRTVRPTPAGHRLLDCVGDILRAVRSLHTVVRDDVVAGELRLGAINTALHTLLPHLLHRVATAHPDVTVFIQSGASLQLFEAVRQGEIDAAVCLHPEFALAKSMAWEPLREEPLVVLAPRALAQHAPLDLLRSQPLLRYDRSVGGGKLADRYLRKHCIAPLERFELGSLLAIALMVQEGLGVSLVPDIDSPLTNGLDIVRLPLPDASEPRRLGVIWMRGSPRARLVAAFLAQARAGPTPMNRLAARKKARDASVGRSALRATVEARTDGQDAARGTVG